VRILINLKSAVGIPHSQVILVNRGRLGGISKMPLLPLRGLSVNGMYVCIFSVC
jgi:hypothetical protein